MDSNVDKLVRKTAMVASVTAAYFLLTSDYGNQPNILDPSQLFSPPPSSLFFQLHEVHHHI
ncbi:hypothetical protein MKX01_019721 [Papaver californicum]|nr:hypothetical protein MKX01_019721 [Papaver californicum]